MPNATPATPFTVRPRLDRKPWGGTRLAAFGHAVDGGDEPLGEVLVTAGESIVTSGAAEGQALGDLVRADPAGMAGPLGTAATGGRPLFPLLVKLIDAAQHLSVQVHPDDAGAAPYDSLGKTEAWHVFSADTDGALFLGVDGIDLDGFMAACDAGDGSSARYLVRQRAVPGTSVTIPAGTVHALGAGVVVYEVQQPSALTWRLDDWGRVGADGQPRERHLGPGRDASRLALRPVPHVGIPIPDPGGARRLVAATRYFALERLEPATDETMTVTAAGSAQVLTVTAGTATIGDGPGALTVGTGASAVVPAAVGTTSLRGPAGTVVLRAWVPDVATEVIGTARAAGANDTELAALGL